MDSNGTPTARSANPSLSKSPAASAKPNKSLVLGGAAHPGLFWVKVWLPDPVSPAALPYSTLTAPA